MTWYYSSYPARMIAYGILLSIAINSMMSDESLIDAFQRYIYDQGGRSKYRCYSIAREIVIAKNYLSDEEKAQVINGTLSIHVGLKRYGIIIH
jgi:hypothetical protein